MRPLFAILISCVLLLSSCSMEFTGIERKSGAIILIVIMVSLTLVQGEKKTKRYN